MDVRTARTKLHRETRLRLGETVTIRAKVRGEMSIDDDPERAEMADLRVRFDIDPGLEFLGGHERGASARRFAGRRVTVSVPREDLAWLPVQGDEVEVTSLPDEPRYSVVRVADDQPRNIVLYLSSEGLAE